MARHITDHENGGSSVAIVTAANAPRNKFNIIWQLLKLKSNDFTCRLRYMFRSLPRDAELCLLICSIFPDDYGIPIEDLVIYGMGLELFEDVHDVYAARYRVHDIISIINDHKHPRKAINGTVRLAYEKDLSQDQHVKMLVGAHDLAKWISSWYPLVFRREIVTEKWLKSNRYEDCYGLSLVLKNVNEHPVNLKCPKLTLLRLQYREDSQSIPVDFFQGMKEIRVLSLDLPSPPQSLNVLRNLKTLHLKVPKFEDTSWIGGLTTLEFLSISVLNSTDVPREIGQLENLRSLDLRKMNIAYIPTGTLSKLVKLEALYMPLSFRKWGCKAKKYDDYDEWESMEENFQDDEGRINANISEIVCLSLKTLQIGIPKASFLPKKSLIFKNVQEFKILMPNYVKWQPFGKDSVNELQLIGDASDIKESGVCDLMGKTENLILTRVRSLKNVLYQLGDDFPQLKKMMISECDELEYVVDTTEKQKPSEGECLFRKLECLHLSILSGLKEICHKRWKYFQWLPNLSKINISFCHKLKYVFPLSIVKRSMLKSIEILDCNEMEGIFYEDEEDDIPFTVCSIENLELHSLPRLLSSVVHKDNMINEVCDDKNETLTTDMVSLNNMEVDGVFASKLAKKWLQNLTRLKIAFCNVKVIFLFEEDNANSSAFNSLKELELHGLQNLVHVWFQVPPKITAFQNLQLLVLSECRNLYLFSPQVAILLVHLAKLFIGRCELMEEIIAKEAADERAVKYEIVFPRLKLLELQHMPNLGIFSGGIREIILPLLECLKLNQCNEMRCFSSGVLRTPKLERIEINRSLCSFKGDLNTTIKRFAAKQKGQPFIGDLEIATGRFRRYNLVGKGSFSEVYRGWMDHKTFAPTGASTGTEVAIKKFNLEIQPQFKELELQVKFLESLSHPNLVKLLGHCWEDEQLLLVYEYMQRKSLDGYLFRESTTRILPWNTRIKIAIGVARGLNFLRTLEKKLIHGNIKSSNILLDENYNAKVSNYGLAMLRELSSKDTERRVVELCRYDAPESLATGHLAAKSDVYGFGVVLLQLMTGLSALSAKLPNGRPHVVDWLKPILSRKISAESIMDERLEGRYLTEAMLLAAKLALRCVESDAENRPSMKQVVEALEQINECNQENMSGEEFWLLKLP